MKKFDEYMKQNLFESSLAKVYQKVSYNKISFGVVSSYRKKNNDIENKKLYKELKKNIREKGYGYIELTGGFEEEDGRVEEKSLIIHDIKKDELIELGNKYEQESVIFKDPNIFVEIDCRTSKPIRKFKNTLSLDVDILEDYFSRLLKGSHSEKSFKFILEEIDNIGMKMFYGKVKK